MVATVATTTALLVPQGAAAAETTAFKALSGSAASSYTVPADMQLVRRLAFGGRTYERYQQVYGPAGVFVLGGQISVYRDASGAVRTVIGSHYRGDRATELREAPEGCGLPQGRPRRRRVGERGPLES